MQPRRILWLGALLTALAPLLANERRDQWAGPLRLAGGHPFQAIFLSTPPLDPVLPPRPTFDWRLSHTNTQTVSPNIYGTPAGQALQNNTALDRPQQPLDAASLAATARLLPGEAFFFADTETTRLDLEWTHPFDHRWAVQLEVPIWGHHGGVFDDVITGFHRAFNFPDLGRSDAPPNRTQLFVAHGADSRYYDGPFEPALGDIVLRGLHAPLGERPPDPAVALSAALKFPTGPVNRFLGSGDLEFGLGLHVARTLGSFRLAATVGHNWHPGWRGLRSLDIANTWDFHLAGEAKLSDNWSALALVSRMENALQHVGPRTFARPAYNIAAGFAYRADSGLLLEGSFWENLTEDRNSFDAGLQFRARWTP